MRKACTNEFPGSTDEPDALGPLGPGCSAAQRGKAAKRTRVQHRNPHRWRNPGRVLPEAGRW